MQLLYADMRRAMQLNDDMIGLVAKAYALKPGHEIGVSFRLGKLDEMVVNEKHVDGAVLRVRVYKKV